MGKFIVWEAWAGDGNYIGCFLEDKKDHADMLANAYNGKVVKSVRQSEPAKPDKPDLSGKFD